MLVVIVLSQSTCSAIQSFTALHFLAHYINYNTLQPGVVPVLLHFLNYIVITEMWSS